MDGVGSDRFELLAQLTARLASTAHLDDIVSTVLDEIVELGFGAVWMAVLDESSGNLHTLKEVIDGVDTTHEMPKIFALDMRQPVGHGFRERRMINIVDPDALFIIERDEQEVPSGRLALPRVIYDHMRGHPFACGPLLGSRGQPVGALGLSSYRGKQPIPDELFSEGLLRAFMNHLGIAMERAADVAKLERLNADLVRAQATIAADARIKAVGELAAAVAHDLNNLAGVALMAISVGERSDAAARDALPKIAHANRAISDLVSRLQRVARTGTLGGAGEVVNVVQIIDDVVTLIAPITREHGIVLHVVMPAVAATWGDPALLRQIVLNLVLNAHDALSSVPPERRRLQIQLVAQDDRLRLTITDRGDGIPASILSHLFQPFVTSKPGHTGIGLAAAHASLKHFGGEITGSNAPEGGAVFDVVLPATSSTSTPSKPAPPPVVARRSQRVLIVDDDADILIVVREFLEPLGYRTVSAMSADDAIDIATAEPFDFILCDVGMPKRNGLDVCHVLRVNGYRGKIILMTGWDRANVVADRRSFECDLVLPKPFLGTDLLRALDSVS
jgi:signal transduction histidine kinase/CheY-like chemotaxis protein